MPSFKSHKEFVKNNPYRNWFLISIGSNIIGSIYVLYDNGIGLNLEEKNYGLVTKIIKKLTSRIKPLKSKPSLRNNKFHLNIPFSNQKLKSILIEAGESITQLTIGINCL